MSSADSPAIRKADATQAGADFNGDGFADLAVGGGIRSVGNDAKDDGEVLVIYGSARGLIATGSQSWRDSDFGGGINQSFGAALATGNFDGDAFSDLAVGIPDAPVGSAKHAGKVRIVYGSHAGLTTARSSVWSQDAPGVRGRAESGGDYWEHFGVALAAANLGQGHEDDLAIGVPGEDNFAGGVNVLYGSSGGLSAKRNQLWSQASRGITGSPREGNGFGFSLATGHLAGRVFADLAVGVPWDRVGRKPEAGAVNIIYGSASGLSANGSQRWTQDSPGIAGRSEPEDLFGYSLSAAPFAGRVFDDLAVGVPGENRWRGAVNVVYGSARGLTAKGNQLWSQASNGIPGKPEPEDTFGWSLSAGNFGHDYGGHAFADLAIHVPQEFTDAAHDLGMVEVMYGTVNGLAATHSQALTHPGDDQSVGIDVSWRLPLAAANFGNNFGNRAYDDLVVGRWMQVLYGSGAGITARRSRTWTPSDLRHPEIWFGFGDALAS